VTGWLARLAARAGGAEAGGTPRLPARFDPAEREQTGQFEETVEVRLPSTLRAAATAVGPDPKLPPRDAGVTSTATTGAPDSRKPPARARRPPGTRALIRSAGAAPQPIVDLPPPDPGRPAEPSAIAARLLAAATTHRPRTPGPALVPATPAPAGPAPWVAPPGHAAPTSPPRTGPDVVHVTIGRVEVRSPAPVPPPVEPTTDRPAGGEPVSLSDYLRGHRKSP